MTCSPIVPAVPSLAEPADCCSPSYIFAALGVSSVPPFSSGNLVAPDVSTWLYNTGQNYSLIIGMGTYWLLWSNEGGGVTYKLNGDGTVSSLGASPPTPAFTNAVTNITNRYLQKAPNGNFMGPLYEGALNNVESAPYSLVGGPATAFVWQDSPAIFTPLGFGPLYLNYRPRYPISIGTDSIIIATNGLNLPWLNDIILVKSSDGVLYSLLGTFKQGQPSINFPYFENTQVAAYGIPGKAMVVWPTILDIFGNPGLGFIFVTSSSATPYRLASNPLHQAVLAYFGGTWPYGRWVSAASVTYITSTSTWVVALYYIALPLTRVFWATSDNDGATWTIIEKNSAYIGTYNYTLVATGVGTQLFASYTEIDGDHLPTYQTIIFYTDPTDTGTVVYSRFASGYVDPCPTPIAATAVQRP